MERTPLFADPRCPACSLPLIGAACDCRELPDRIDRLWVAAPYDGWVRTAIHSYKFSGETARAPHFASLLASACLSIDPGAALAPVPLHPRRRRQRGYDQTAMLASEVSKRTGQPVFTGLRKGRDTLQQVGLSRAERSLNLLDAFELANGVSSPDTVILIDDVATTGATLSECAIALRSGGTTRVAAVVIAHGL
ncbi:MAG TPA: ComF family protein [Thermomicrobiales bacterium]|nr:ComF family protein [Thermomicrobiales bacterium]